MKIWRFLPHDCHWHKESTKIQERPASYCALAVEYTRTWRCCWCGRRSVLEETINPNAE